MPVDTQDSDWSRHKLERDQVAAVISGANEAKRLIPIIPGWDTDTHQLVQDRAYFLPMVSRTLETFGGLVFLKAPARTFPEGLERLTDDITQTGQEIDRFAEAAFDAVFKTGAVAILPDYPPVPEGMSKAEAEAEGYRPFLRQYDANSILSARMEKRGGAVRLVQVRLLEEYEVQGSDEFTFTTEPQVRVLELDDADNYRQRIFRKASGMWKAVGETIEPKMNGAPIKRIPLFFSNTRDNEPRPEKPPLSDLADINLKHLVNSADYEWALAWLRPFLFGAGIKLGAGETISLGSSEAIIAPSHEAKLEIVQADAAKFSGLKVAMDDKRRDAAALGARMLLESARTNIAAETARIERAGEISVVGAAANAVSQCLTNALRFLCEWAGLPATVPQLNAQGEPVKGKDGKPVERPILYWMNTDLMPTRMTPQELTALLDAWLKGAVSKKELFARLQESEVVDPAKSYEDHEEEIAEEQANGETPEELGAAAGNGTEPGEPEEQAA